MYPALERFVNNQKWLDDMGDPLQEFIGTLFSNGGTTGQGIKNFLNGTWLGHPLHPVITDIPVGAWVTTLVLDTASSISDDRGLETAADLSLTVGLAASAGAAVTGWTDWSDTYGQERKLGLLHALFMVGTITAYISSLVARRSGARSAGKVLSNVGLALVSAGAYLGGDEVYDLGYGVNHTAFIHGSTDYVPAMAVADLQENTPTKAEVNGVSVVLVKQGSQIFALNDTCVHAGCSLAGGRLEGASIVCPCHGSQFDLQDGSVLNGPATRPEPHFNVRVQNGTIEVKQA